MLITFLLDSCSCVSVSLLYNSHHLWFILAPIALNCWEILTLWNDQLWFFFEGGIAELVKINIIYLNKYIAWHKAGRTEWIFCNTICSCVYRWKESKKKPSPIKYQFSSLISPNVLVAKNVSMFRISCII